jgi:hypothetical protein
MEKNFVHRKNPVLKNQHLIECGNVSLHLHEADFDSDEEINEFIEFLLKKLNA